MRLLPSAPQSVAALAALLVVPALPAGYHVLAGPAAEHHVPDRQTTAGDPASPNSPFIVEPYLQLGDAPFTGNPVTMTLMWHADSAKANWEVDVKPAGKPAWTPMRTVQSRKIAPPGFPAHRVYEVTLGELTPGSTFEYRVKKDSAVVFTATGHARKGPTQPYRVVVFGDCGVNGAAQKEVAYRTYVEHPDLVAIAGDIVYGSGRMSEYRTNYFPIYNADSASAGVGAPLARSVPFVGALGNHDAHAAAKGDSVLDELAYYAYWSMPLNGPYAKPGRNTTPLWGDSTLGATIARPLMPRFPRMANYSFDYGNAHWTVLDANPYVDWTDPVLRNWVAQDLANAKGATWKFVMFHQPGFNSSREHFSEQQMRLLADVFQAGGVDIVYAGHVHNYQRSFPLTFLPKLVGDPKVAADGSLHAPDSYREPRLPYAIDGDFTLDHEFDGARHTVPKGVIYIVTGAGGAGLYTPEQTGERGSWQPFTNTFIADRHSLSVVDVNGKTLTFRQLAADGTQVDKFIITKPFSHGTQPHAPR
jgi:predicted phosphodiesterase